MAEFNEAAATMKAVAETVSKNGINVIIYLSRYDGPECEAYTYLDASHPGNSNTATHVMFDAIREIMLAWDAENVQHSE